MLKMLRKISGQSTVEYVILFAGVVLVFATLIGPKGKFSQRLEQSIDDASEAMTKVSGRLSNAFQ